MKVSWGLNQVRAKMASVTDRYRRITLLAVVLAALGVSGCVSGPPDDPRTVAALEANDPYEPMNRISFDINQKFENYFLAPVGEAYITIFPSPVRDATRNFLNNTDTPVILANDLLQGEFARAGDTLARFGINSTIGLGGLLDVAADWGIPRHTEDFGQTLAVWGLDSGPYLYLLGFGPSNMRHLVGTGVDIAFDPATYISWDDRQLLWVPYLRRGIKTIDVYSRNMNALDEIERSSLDYYASVRSLYQQSRKNAIRNGAPDFDDLPDF